MVKHTQHKKDMTKDMNKGMPMKGHKMPEKHKEMEKDHKGKMKKGK